MASNDFDAVKPSEYSDIVGNLKSSIDKFEIKEQENTETGTTDSSTLDNFQETNHKIAEIMKKYYEHLKELPDALLQPYENLENVDKS